MKHFIEFWAAKYIVELIPVVLIFSAIFFVHMGAIVWEIVQRKKK